MCGYRTLNFRVIWKEIRPVIVILFRIVAEYIYKLVLVAFSSCSLSLYIVMLSRRVFAISFVNLILIKMQKIFVRILEAIWVLKQLKQVV